MQYIEFQIVNTYLMNLGGGDPLEQTRLRSEYLDRLRIDQDERSKQGMPIQDVYNPFPVWLKNLIKEVAVEHSSLIRFDDENRVYKMRIKGERDDFEDEFYPDWAVRFEKERTADPERLKWSSENMVRVTATGESEQDAMYELDVHHSGGASTQSRGSDAAKREQTARAQAAQA